MSHAEIAIAIPLRRTFFYEVPEKTEILVGSRVIVPFGNRSMVGYVMGVSKDLSSPVANIKKISSVCDDEPVFSKDMVELLKWMADYYCLGIGETCKAALPKALASVPKVKKQSRTLKKTAADGGVFSAPDVILNAGQAAAFKDIKKQIDAGGFQTTLIHGITGSGKTEVYLRLFKEAIDSGKSAIFLVPEIGMTPQAVGRLTSRFGDKVAVYHSALTDARRLYEWKRMQSGEARVVIGTRSAVFAPFKDLGLIVIDEEHDASYKQDEAPRYNGRDSAIMRAKIGGIPCVLGSATPSMESFSHARSKKYRYIHLSERPTGGALPEVEVVDMREVPKGAFYSPQLIGALADSLSRKEQAIIFLNRRGFASFVLCRDCGEAMSCPNCNIALTYHQDGDFLLCHYCDYKVKQPPRCPKCGGGDVGRLGVGTQKIESELKGLFPKARIERFDRDTAAQAGFRTKVLSEMRSGKIDILVGTQMVTKGHDFPGVTCVGIIDADMSLNFPDFRSAEKTFQLLSQVAGRAGRAENPGRVIIQTYMPDHYAIQASQGHDFAKFFDEEIGLRKELAYPPHGRLALIKLKGLNGRLVEEVARQVATRLASSATDGTKVLGPAPSPIAKVRGKYRWHILIKGRDHLSVRRVINYLDSISNIIPSGVGLARDIDPVNLL